MINIEIPKTSKLHDIKQVDEIPQKRGVYFLYSKTHDLLYVGKAKNLRIRIREHINGNTNTKDFSNKIKEIEYFVETNAFHAELYETYIINTLKPKYNVSKVYKIDENPCDEKSFSFISSMLKETEILKVTEANYILSMNELPLLQFYHPSTIEAFNEIDITFDGLNLKKNVPVIANEQAALKQGKFVQEKKKVRKKRKVKSKTVNKKEIPKVMFLVKDGTAVNVLDKRRA